MTYIKHGLIKFKINDQLNETAWYMLSDSGLTSSQIIIATQEDDCRMTQTIGFGWTYSSSASYAVTEFLQDLGGPVLVRNIDPVNYKPYLDWLPGNTPVYLSTLDGAGNPNVLFTGGTLNTTMYPGFSVYVGGTPTTNPQVATDNAAAALAVAQAFTSCRQWVYYNQIVILVAADVAAGKQWTVISQALFNQWYTWGQSVLVAFEAYVTTPTTANLAALQPVLGQNPTMNL